MGIFGIVLRARSRTAEKMANIQLFKFKKIKELIREHCPTCYSILKRVKWIILDKHLETPKYKFTHIYHTHRFGGTLSASGQGSDLIRTEIIRRKIPILIKEMNVRVLLDCPCGDFYWLQHSKFDIEKYIGVDIVKKIININQQKYGNKYRKFKCLDISKDALPKADMILCRDCLVHFSFKDILSTIRNFKRSGSRYILTTTFSRRLSNIDINTGGWRTLNLQLLPFSFPRPIKLIDEKCDQAEGTYSDKSLGLWRLEDIAI